MKTEDRVLNHCSEWQVVEELSELFPHVGITVLAEALIIESVSKSQRERDQNLTSARVSKNKNLLTPE